MKRWTALLGLALGLGVLMPALAEDVKEAEKGTWREQRRDRVREFIQNRMADHSNLEIGIGSVVIEGRMLHSPVYKLSVELQSLIVLLLRIVLVGPVVQMGVFRAGESDLHGPHDQQ